MPGLQTGGSFLGVQPRPLDIPSNVGKFSTQEVNQTEESSADFARRMLNAAAQYQADQATLGNTAAQQRAAATTAAPVAQAKIAEAGMTAGQNAPDIIAGTRSKTLAGLDADLAAEQLRRDDINFKAGLGPANRMVLAAKGVPTETTTGTERTPAGTTVQTSKETATIPGQEGVPIKTDTYTAPTAPVITNVPGGPNGTSLGAVVSAMGPGGKSATEVIHSPIAALNNITSESTVVKVGERRDPEGNKIDIMQRMVRGSAGGAAKPDGAPYEVVSGTNPNATGASAASQPFISKDAMKAIEDAQGEVQALQQRKVELGNIRNQAENYIGSTVGAGKFTGPIRAFLGDAAAQGFTGSVQNALSTALQPLRGTGRVSQSEFNQALSALPTINDQAETIRAKMDYLGLVTDWAEARQQAILKNLGQGMNRYQAVNEAMKATPVPEVPNFQAGATAAPAPGGAPAAGAATPPTVTNQQQYDALPPGADYLGPDGVPHKKKGGA